MLLALDACTATGSVALFDGASLRGERTVAMKAATKERLMPAVVDLVNAHTSWAAIARVVVGGGPGSFTSLRIAASIAKGVASALGVELWVVPSLALMDPSGGPGGAARYLMALDAMRGEYFASQVDVDASGAIERIGAVERVPLAALVEAAAKAKAILVGPGGPMHLPGVPHARRAGALVGGGFAARVDLASWEPDYGRLAEAQVKWEAEHQRPLVRAVP